MLVDFDNKGEPFIADNSLRLVPAINDMMKRTGSAKANLLFVVCMIDYESPFLMRYPIFEERKEAVLKAYANRRVGGALMKKEDIETEWIKKAMEAYHEVQKDSDWDFYYALLRKITEADTVLGEITLNLGNVEEQGKMIKLRKESQLTFEDVRKRIITKVQKSTTSTGKAKAHQLRDIQFKAPGQ